MAKKKGEKRVRVILACAECGERNYYTTRNKVNTANKLELRKYCRHSRTVTVHKETK